MRCLSRLKPFLACLALVFVLGIDVAHAADDLPNTPPSDPPFYGGYYISGYSAAVGNATIYVPVGEGWCLDQNGFLFHCGTGSVTGLLITENGTEYTFNAPAYSTPRYRDPDGASYTYVDLYFNPSAANVVVEDTFGPVYSQDVILQYCLILLFGFACILLMTRR